YQSGGFVHDAVVHLEAFRERAGVVRPAVHDGDAERRHAGRSRGFGRALWRFVLAVGAGDEAGCGRDQCESGRHSRRMPAWTRPPPKPYRRIVSPSRSLPSRWPSMSASGIVAAEVLPKYSMLESVRSTGMPTRSHTASVMRRFALWGTNQSIAS